MFNARRIAAISGTFATIIGVGFIMQTTSPKPEDSAQTTATSVVTPDPRKTDTRENQLELTNIVNTSALPPIPVDEITISVLPAAPIIKVAADASTPVVPPVEIDAPSRSCDIKLDATIAAAAMVNLDLDAPCFPNERLTIHHNGMMFSETTTNNGTLQIQVPALAQTAVFIVSFANGDGGVASIKVPSMEFIDRVVVQWRGAAGMQLHAREFGANYGDTGHVWAGSVGQISAAAAGQGGFLTQLGVETLQRSLIAEVYTFPTGTARNTGDIRLSVEAEVTVENCGKNIEAQTLQVSMDSRLKTQDLSLAIPDCDAIGDFLVLNNLLDSLTIAQK